MRPRGLSRSSPSSTKVGQVAVQKPQCTHLRRICSLRAVSGSLSWARVKLVCIRETLRGVAQVEPLGRLLRLRAHAQGAFEPQRGSRRDAALAPNDVADLYLRQAGRL